MNKVIRKIKLPHECNGVASEREMLVISSRERCTIVKLNDMSQTILEGVRAHRISFFKGNIYSANYFGKTICCYKSTGEELWTFQYEEMNVNSPGGLTLDTNGFVYWVCRRNNSIEVISADGTSHTTILSEADGIKDPFANRHQQRNRDDGSCK
ncbi:unnamed protein product [Mytilus edulis]|uniref:Uncharacterized protein n=1 Tax=Mytilus edulis TaxID=6550 RepID=A0A8S3UWH1_MYTED|nr:unnamed protein product [Mytilus edulis]